MIRFIYFKWLVVGLTVAVPFIRWLVENNYFADWGWPSTILACSTIVLACVIIVNLGLFTVKTMIMGGLHGIGYVLRSFFGPLGGFVWHVGRRFVSKTFGQRRRRY